MARSAKPKEVVVFKTRDGKEPFQEWLDSIKDSTNRLRILARIRRLEHGNFCDCEPVGEGVSELSMFFGPGYRVYFGETANTIVVLLNCGDKSSQKKDIKLAKTYWQEYLNNEKI